MKFNQNISTKRKQIQKFNCFYLRGTSSWMTFDSRPVPLQTVHAEESPPQKLQSMVSTLSTIIFSLFKSAAVASFFSFSLSSSEFDHQESIITMFITTIIKDVENCKKIIYNPLKINRQKTCIYMELQ